jgi:hypothetical protein
MRGITSSLAGALVLALLGTMCLVAGRLDRQIARTQQSLATSNDDDPEEAFTPVEGYLRYASYLPWIGNGPLNDVRARKAAMQYWQRHYELIVPADTDPIAATPPDNVPLQRIVANAVYRMGQPQAHDRATSLRVLNAAINAYFAVLKNAGRDETAAYNYEYLVRLRDDVERGGRSPDLAGNGDEAPAGREGGPPVEDPNRRNFQILVPLDADELDKAIGAGKGTPLPRKG